MDGMLDKRPLRIGLVAPRGPLYRHRTGIWKKSLRYAPLTLTTLAALVPPEIPHTITLIDEGVDDIPLDLDVDLLGITAITGTAPRAYELSRHFRSRGISVVLGGVHVTLMPEEAQLHADSIVVGYAEETWPELLHDFVQGQLKPLYRQQPGLSLAGRPFAKRDLYGQKKIAIFHTLEASRACIHSCEFCVVPTAWGTRPLQRPVGEVVADIKQMGAKRAIFLDLNLIADLHYAKELFTALIPLKISWGGLATTLVGRDDELLDLMARSGCKGLLIGLESLCSASLKETNKAFNARQDYHLLVQKLHQHGIALMGCFVFGFDHDTKEVFEETVDFAYQANIDLPRYAILTPFPSTPLFKRLKSEGRILHQDWSLYDGQHVVFEPKIFSPQELLNHTNWAWKKTYSYRSIAKRLMNSRLLFPLSLGANLGYRFYAHNLHRFYTCDWPTLPMPGRAVGGRQ